MAETEPSQTASYSWRPNSTHETKVLHPSRWDVWTPNQVPTFPFKPGFPSDFAISVSSTWILPRIEPEIHSWRLPWLAPPPSPLVWTLKQLLSVPTTWQFILINTAPVKWLKGKCIYSLPSQRLGTPYGKGWGLSLCWMPHKADLQKLQRYLFINSINRHLVSLHSEHSAQHLHSGALGSVSLHSIKGRAGGSTENSASAGLIYSLDHLRWTGNWDLFPPKKEVYWEAPHLPLPPKETSEKRNIRC